MLTQLRLINWKSFRDTTLYLDPLTVLIGMNSSGKSNVLDALLFLKRICSGIPISTAIIGRQDIPGLRGGLEWIARKPEHCFTLEVEMTREGEADVHYAYSITVEVNGSRAELREEHLTLHQQNKTRKLFFTKQDEPGRPAIATGFYTGSRERVLELNRAFPVLSQIESLNVRQEIKKGAREVLEQLKRIFILDPIPNHMRNYQPLSEELQRDASNMAGVLAALPEPRKKEVEATLSRYLAKLPERDIRRVWTELVGKFQTDAMLYCEEEWTPGDNPTVVDLRGMSDGTLRFLAIVTALLTLEEGSLLVVEEVDNGLHPSRARLLVEMLEELGEKRRIDVLVTTHNPALLDALGAGRFLAGAGLTKTVAG